MRSCKILARSVETLRQYSKFSLIIKEEAHADALASKRTIKKSGKSTGFKWWSIRGSNPGPYD